MSTEWLKNKWTYITGAFILLISIVFSQKKQIKELKVDNAVNENKVDNAVLNAKIEASNQSLEEARKKLEAEKQREVSDEELLEFLKKV